MSGLLFKIAAIGIAGIGAQWAAWRLRIPAIALLLVAGLILGPLTGYVNPETDFGALYKPILALSVSIILFEGGLTLNFKEIRETSIAVRRLILFGGPLVWLFSTLAAHYAAGLSWPTAFVLGAILVVTGPTVIMPLLRQAQLAKRPASLLRWEAIVNDPIGALFAVLSFETYLVLHGNHDGASLIWTAFLATVLALVGGYLGGRLIALMFVRAFVPEFLKAPVLLVIVLLAYALSDLVLEESGLLTVTVMGITLANSRMASLTELRRFKETITVLLVSGLFIMLTASLDMSVVASLGWGAVLFVALILFIVRPAAIFLATIDTGLSFQERAFVAWIAPRGIVAVAVSGLFGSALADLGVEDANRLTALTFAVVATTILLHGFSLGPLARILGLKSTEKPGVLIVGGSKWSEALAEKLQENDIPVLITDSNWNHIKSARLANIPVHFGEVLSEAAHHDIAFNQFGYVIAATDNDAYNTLVCTEFGPEIGRSHVFQIDNVHEDAEKKAISFTIGGRALFNPGQSYSQLRRSLWLGHTFQSTTLTEEFGFEDYQKSRAEGFRIILWIKPNGSLQFQQGKNDSAPDDGDTIIGFGSPPPDEADKNSAKRNKENS